MSAFIEEKKSSGITDVPGFQSVGTSCDVRDIKDDRLDLALIFSPTPCSAAGVFTKNAISAAPVNLCRELLRVENQFHGVVVNSGNANACTGERGMKDAWSMQFSAASACNTPPETFFVCSTGRIGEVLPMPKIRVGIKDAAANLGSTKEHGLNTAKAILTSDTKEKIITVKIPHLHAGDKASDLDYITISGIAKGAGMIQPNMATMLAFIATDADISKTLLQKILAEAVELSFNAITVDGDMSTNDTVILLANGKSGIKVSPTQSSLFQNFVLGLRHVCAVLADKIVSDGERITKVVELCVMGAKNKTDANKIARSIGNSLLVKTSWYGSDPNWGRILDAAGYSGASIQEEKLDLAYATPTGTTKQHSVPVITKGRCLLNIKSRWKDIVSKKRFSIILNLNLGKASYRLLSTDLSEAYVDFNKSE